MAMDGDSEFLRIGLLGLTTAKNDRSLNILKGTLRDGGLEPRNNPGR